MNRDTIRRNIINLLGFTSFVLAAVFTALYFIARIDNIHIWYEEYQGKLLQFESAVRGIEDKWLFLIVILLLFCMNGIFPILSTSAVCLLTGAAFPVFFALPFNIFGIIIIFSIKYYWGRRIGGGNAQKLIYKNETARRIMEKDGTGNPWLLVAFRLIPSFPVNSVSQLYGKMRFKYTHFILLSLLGYAPKFISFTFIGRHVYDPLSGAFLTPIIAFLIISGFSLLSINAIWNFVEKNIRFRKMKKILNGKSKK